MLFILTFVAFVVVVLKSSVLLYAKMSLLTDISDLYLVLQFNLSKIATQAFQSHLEVSSGLQLY